MPRKSNPPASSPAKPTRQEVAAAYGRTIPDLIAPGLAVLFCGINPSLYSAAVGLHFARPGNRFWPTLHAAGFTDRLLRPSEQPRLLDRRLGITNLVARATATAEELSAEELIKGAGVLEAKVRLHRPAFLAVLGVTAYRAAFGRRLAAVGRQADDFAGAGLWILPNPSGRNQHFTMEPFKEFRRALGPLLTAEGDVP